MQMRSHKDTHHRRSGYTYFKSFITLIRCVAYLCLPTHLKTNTQCRNVSLTRPISPCFMACVWALHIATASRVWGNCYGSLGHPMLVCQDTTQQVTATCQQDHPKLAVTVQTCLVRYAYSFSSLPPPTSNRKPSHRHIGEQDRASDGNQGCSLFYLSREVVFCKPVDKGYYRPFKPPWAQ